jgi:DNA-binding XRE family transcriptional regulator
MRIRDGLATIEAMPRTGIPLLDRRARDRRILGELLADARRAAGMSQTEAGGATGLSQSTIAKIERGTRAVSFIEALEFADAYRVSAASLDPRTRAGA